MSPRAETRPNHATKRSAEILGALTLGGIGSCWHRADTGDDGGMVDVDEDTFGALVEQALDSIPPQLGRLMRNVAVVVEDMGASPNLLGLYEGVPLTARTSAYGGVLPDRITI